MVKRQKTITKDIVDEDGGPFKNGTDKATGNPIFAVLFVLLTLICNSVIVRRK